MKETSSLVKPQERAKWGEALLRLSTRMFTLQCSNETASYTGFKRKNIKHFTFEPFCFFRSFLSNKEQQKFVKLFSPVTLEA